MLSFYRLHIYIAEGGTPLLDPAYTPTIIPTGKTSLAGHMWYSVQVNNDKEQCYGFMSVNGLPHGEGKVATNDNYVYYLPRYKRTMVITEKQYIKLHDFGSDIEIRKTENFKNTYNAGYRSCIDFTWIALKYASLWWKTSAVIFNEQAGEYQTISIPKAPITSDYEGDLIPSANWDDVLRIINPSDLNDELKQFAHFNTQHINPPPEQTIKDFYIDASTDEIMSLVAKESDVFVEQVQQDRIKTRYKKYIQDNPPPQKLPNNNLNSAPLSSTNNTQTQTSQPLFQGVANTDSKLACIGCGNPVSFVISASSNVFTNDKPNLKVGDVFAPYTCPVCLTSAPGGKIVTGSSFIFINGAPLVSLGDTIETGETIISASPDVFAVS